MSASLPPRARLSHVVRAIAAALPGQVPLLDAERFAEGRAALLRLAETADRAAAAMAPEEAAWMADTLLERWSWVADPVLPPAAAVLLPEDLWVGDRPRTVQVTLATHGLEDDWEALWEGSVTPGPPGRTTTVMAPPPEGGGRATVTVRARVRGRALGGARLVLIAEATARVRRPWVLVSEDGRRILVRDQAEEPAVGVEVEIAETRLVTGAGGLIELPRPAPVEAEVRVQGILAGRLRGKANP